MSDELHDAVFEDTAHLDDFFSQFSWAFLNFAAEHHLQVDKYWHNFPSWRFSFKHPKGGIACIEVFKDGQKQLSILAYWWLDNYDEGTRRSTRYESKQFDLESIDMADLLNQTLNILLLWSLESFTEITTGLGESWKKCFSKEEFLLQMEGYPTLRPYSFQG